MARTTNTDTTPERMAAATAEGVPIPDEVPDAIRPRLVAYLDASAALGAFIADHGGASEIQFLHRRWMSEPSHIRPPAPSPDVERYGVLAGARAAAEAAWRRAAVEHRTEWREALPDLTLDVASRAVDALTEARTMLRAVGRAERLRAYVDTIDDTPGSGSVSLPPLDAPASGSRIVDVKGLDRSLGAAMTAIRSGVMSGNAAGAPAATIRRPIDIPGNHGAVVSTIA